MSENKDSVFHVKIFGCTNKELEINQPKIILKEISILSGIHQDTTYIIDGKSYSPDSEVELYDHIELKCMQINENGKKYRVNITGCIQKTIIVTKEKIALAEISKDAGLPEDSLYIIDDKAQNASFVLTVHDDIQIICKKLGRDS